MWDSRWAWSSLVAWTASAPGGTRRLTSARAPACTDGVAPTTGGQSMPRTVTAGRAQMRSATVPEPISSTPSSTLASWRNASSSYWTVPRGVGREPVDRRRTVLAAQRVQYADQRAECVGRRPAELARVQVAFERVHLHA